MDPSKILLLLCFLSLVIQNDAVHCGIRGFLEVPLSEQKRDAVIETMLKVPKATFYRGENMTGEAVNYDSTNSTYQGSCQLFQGGIKSMGLSDSCVRVFRGAHCNGMSRSIYPDYRSYPCFVNFITSELPVVNSVGPCPPNEFQTSELYSSLIKNDYYVRKDGSNIRQIPDLVDFQGKDAYASKATRIDQASSTTPVHRYYMEHGTWGRPKWIEAIIYSRNLNNSADSLAGRNLIIPQGLGGPANETYNSFRQTERNFEKWKKITDQIQTYLKENSDIFVALYLTFAYKGDWEHKPYGFFYSIGFVHTKLEIERVNYGFIEN